MFKQQASKANFSKLEYFNENEFPLNSLDYLDFRVIRVANMVRKDTSIKMIPSPLLDAHIRFDSKSKSSQHYAKDRLSTATDMFFLGDVRKMFITARSNSYIGGLGIYLDTVLSGLTTPMIHIDLRPTKLSWVRFEGQYIYDTDIDEFWNLLGDFNG